MFNPNLVMKSWFLFVVVVENTNQKKKKKPKTNKQTNKQIKTNKQTNKTKQKQNKTKTDKTKQKQKYFLSCCMHMIYPSWSTCTQLVCFTDPFSWSFSL